MIVQSVVERFPAAAEGLGQGFRGTGPLGLPTSGDVRGLVEQLRDVALKVCMCGGGSPM